MAALTQVLVLNPMQTLPVYFPLSTFKHVTIPVDKGVLDGCLHDKLAVRQATRTIFRQHFD